MIVYREEDRFNTKTGKKLTPRREETFDRVCDFCGRLIEEEDYEHSVIFEYTLVDNGGCEEVWYYANKPKNVEVTDMFSYMSGLGDTFHYCDGQECQGECSLAAAGFEGCNNLAEALWAARVEAIENTDVDFKDLSRHTEKE